MRMMQRDLILFCSSINARQMKMSSYAVPVKGEHLLQYSLRTTELVTLKKTDRLVLHFVCINHTRFTICMAAPQRLLNSAFSK